MNIGVVSELKSGEGRVALTPAAVGVLEADGHRVSVQSGAGELAGFDDDSFRRTGARVLEGASDVWASSELVLKVKEPIRSEYRYLRPNLALFTYLHLAADRALTEALIESETAAYAYETVALPDGSLPLLTPMSEIAGRLAAYATAHHLLRAHGGRGILAGGAPGVAPARILVLGGGVVGTHAARIARGCEAEVTIIELSVERARALDAYFQGGVRVLVSDHEILERELAAADAVIGAVLVPGAAAPKVVTAAMLSILKPRTLVVDVAIDQGGCFATSRPTTYDEPTYEIDDILHYCVANMPGAVPVTATRALVNATLPFVRRLAVAPDLLDGQVGDDSLARGLNVARGRLCHPAVAAAYPIRSGDDRSDAAMPGGVVQT
jgi:alanine dehydrogenase